MQRTSHTSLPVNKFSLQHPVHGDRHITLCSRTVSSPEVITLVVLFLRTNSAVYCWDQMTPPGDGALSVSKWCAACLILRNFANVAAAYDGHRNIYLLITQFPIQQTLADFTVTSCGFICHYVNARLRSLSHWNQQSSYAYNT